MSTGKQKTQAPRMALRPVIESDLPIFFEHQRDPIAVEMCVFTSRDWPAFVEHWTKRIMAAPTGVARTILIDGQVAGNAVTFDMFSDREIGYWIGREYWGRGLATYAVSELLKLDPIRPIYAHVAKHNAGSLRVLQKCGFMHHGVEQGPPNARGECVEEFVLVLNAAE
ncbi:MAG: GNAT family N-acetyltransferase [Acidobacteriota bacterium]